MAHKSRPNLNRQRNNGSWGSSSWTSDFKGMPAFFASQRTTNDPIKNTRDWALFQDFRFGRQKLDYEFPVKDGNYLVELYFVEPWLGAGGGMNCTGWRLFDVAVNNKTVIQNLDIWKEAGHLEVSNGCRIAFMQLPRLVEVLVQLGCLGCFNLSRGYSSCFDLSRI